jgi:hypothetical protein
MKLRLDCLITDMSARQAGGAKKQGRFKKDDSARKLFINTVALPDLRAGVLPSKHDEKMLFLGPLHKLESSPAKELNRWIDGVYKDPRARQPPSMLDTKKQTTLLQWAQQHAALCTPPISVNQQECASGYLVMWGRFKGKSVASVVNQAQNDKKSTNDGAGGWLLWVCGEVQSDTLGTFNFVWDRHDHIRKNQSIQ